MSRQMSEKKQNELIQIEIDKLKDVFKDISEEKQEVAERLIERVGFMTITLELLEEDIKKKGPIYLFKQGSQKMYVENPSQKSYNTMINRYTAAYGKLFDLLPKESNKDEDDGFDAFIKKRDGD